MTFSLRPWKPGDTRPWRWYRTRARRDEMARLFKKAGWNIDKRDSGRKG